MGSKGETGNTGPPEEGTIVLSNIFVNLLLVSDMVAVQVFLLVELQFSFVVHVYAWLSLPLIHPVRMEVI